MIEGICPQCARPKLVALHNGLCKWHNDKVCKAKKSVQPPNEKSEKQTAADKAYSIVAKAFKAANPICQAQLKGCTKATEDLHHKKGRIGSLLLDERFFLAVCRHCHSEIENKSAYAKSLGLSESRLIKDNNLL